VASHRPAQVLALLELAALPQEPAVDLIGLAALPQDQIVILVGVAAQRNQYCPRPQWLHQKS
jgi:hypothetical protein